MCYHGHTHKRDVQTEDKRMVELDVQRDQIQLSHQQKMKIVSEKVQTLKDIQSFLPAPSTVRPIPKAANKRDDPSVSSVVSPGSSPGGAAAGVHIHVLNRPVRRRRGASALSREGEVVNGPPLGAAECRRR